MEHQLVQERYRGAAVPEYDHVQLRKITAEYIRTHRKDFEGFVCSMVDSLEGMCVRNVSKDPVQAVSISSKSTAGRSHEMANGGTYAIE